MNHSARACWIRHPEFYCFGKRNAKSRSSRNGIDLEKHNSTSNVSLVDSERINAEDSSEHKETKCTVKSKSDNFSDKALDRCTNIVSEEI